jgi:hypothetical protein
MSPIIANNARNWAPGLAELFEGIAQLVAFRILDQLTHVRSVHRAAMYMLAISNPEPKTSFARSAAEIKRRACGAC